MKRLRKWNLNHLALRNKCVLILFFILSMPFFPGSNAYGHLQITPDFGWLLVGTQQCDTHGWFQNLSPGSTEYCGENGCGCIPSEVTRTVNFTMSGGGFSVTPTSDVLPGCSGNVYLNVCVSPGLGDYYGTLTASVSPAFNDGSTSQSAPTHVKGIPSLVTCEPLSLTLNLGSAYVGQTVTNSFQVCNYNSFPVTINSISIDNNNFSVASVLPVTIPPVVSYTTPSCQPITIIFTPETAGNLNGNIQVYTSAQNPTYTCSGIGDPSPYITTSSSGNGTITPSTSVNYGGSITITITPASGYGLASLTDNGKNVTGLAVWNANQQTYAYTISDVTSNHTVQAILAAAYVVTPSEGANGSIRPNTSQPVVVNGTMSFTVTPKSGYYALVTGCGGILSGYTYTTGPIISSCTVSATFVPDFVVTPSAGANGSISPASSQLVPPNGTAFFTVTPNTGYVIGLVTGCGGTLDGNTYLTGPITGNCTVSATFAAVNALAPSAARAFSIPGGILLASAGLGLIILRRRKVNGQTQGETK